MLAAVAAIGLVTQAGCADASRIQQSAALAQERARDKPRFKPPKLPKVAPSAPPVQPGNAGFEAGLLDGCPATWTCRRSGRPTVARSAEVAQRGAHSLQVTLRSEDDSYTLRSEKMPALPLRTYHASIARRSSTSTPAGGESVRLLFYDAKGKLIGSQSDRRGRPKQWVWGTVSAEGNAPAGTAGVVVEITVSGGSRTVWLDQAAVRHSPILEVWGGTSVRRGENSDRLSLQVTTPTPGGVHVGMIDAFGLHLTVNGPREFVTNDGTPMRYSLAGSAEYDEESGTILVPPGSPGTITVEGRFTPTPGTGFPRAVVRDPMARASFQVFVAARNFNESTRAALSQLPDRIALQRSVDRLAAYLDTRMNAGGGWAIAHPYWPGEVRQDPQAIAVLTQGYLRRAQASADPTYEARALRGLDWLVENQRADGSFGLPWAFGRREGHFGVPQHYPDGSGTHAAGEPLAVVTIAGATTLLEGFKVYGNTRYLAGAVRAMDYLLRGPNGFRWLDAEHTRGSIPYCTLEPVLPADDPRVRAHQVLPEVRNTAVEVYNIDGAALAFLSALYVETGDKRLLTYGDAIATNLAAQVRADGMMPYAWFDPTPHSGGYANISLSGLLQYGEMRGRDDWVSQAARGFSWMANHARSDLIPTDDYASVFGLDLSGDVAAYASYLMTRQKADGSFSGGTATRQDAVMFAVLSDLLVDMGG